MNRIVPGMLGVKRTLAEWGASLLALGTVGLFAISLLDSALVPLPGGPDVAMIALSAANPSWMPVYALAATAGSTIGCTLLYLVARRAGIKALNRLSADRRDRIENLLGRYDMLAVMLPAVLPPPFPFKPFVLCAGVFKLRTARFVLAIFIGRAIRFVIEGLLAVKFGGDATELIARHGWKVLIAILIMVGLSVAFKVYRVRSGRAVPLGVDEIPPPG